MDDIKKTAKSDDTVTIAFSPKSQSEEDMPDLYEMTLEELERFQEKLNAQIADLDAAEPADEESEEYETWADQHEDLEDLLDEVLDRLDDLRA